MEPEMDRSGSRLKQLKNSKNELHTALHVNMRAFRKESRRERRQRRQQDSKMVLKVERDYTAIIALLSITISVIGAKKSKCYAQQREKPATRLNDSNEAKK
jgi:hypothetical protein